MTAAIPAPATVPAAPPMKEPAAAVRTAAKACPETLIADSGLPDAAASPAGRWLVGSSLGPDVTEVRWSSAGVRHGRSSGAPPYGAAGPP